MKIEIEYAWEEIEQYVNAVEDGGSIDELWEEIVISPYWEKLCCYSPIDLQERKPKPIRNINQLKVQLELVKKINTERIRSEFEKIVTVLPNYDDDLITVVIFPLEDEYGEVKQKQNGVLGTSLFGNILIQINPFAPQFQQWIPYVFAHEYHHTVWGNYWYTIRGGELENKFIDSLIIDGEADSFALSMYPSLKPQWIFGLSEEEKERLWNNLYSDMVLKKNVDYCKYMFGGEQTGIPWCCGYAIGHMLVQEYIEKTAISIVNIIEVKPEDILQNTRK